MFDKVKRMTTFIGAQSGIIGNVDGGNGDVVIAGRVDGNVSVKAGISAFRGMLKSKNTVYVKGVVFGDINADTVSVDGTVNGSITCENIEIGATGRINGDVFYTGHLRAKPGARISGRMTPGATETVEATGVNADDLPAPNIDWEAGPIPGTVVP